MGTESPDTGVVRLALHSVKKEGLKAVPAVSADETVVMGSTRFVYLDENAGKTAASLHVVSVGNGGGLSR